MIAGVPGAYGIALPDLTDLADQLPEAAAEWEAWNIAHAGPVEAAGRQERIGPDRAGLLLSGGSFVDLDRSSATATYRMSQLPSGEAMVHPLLCMTAAMAARWRGWQSFHAGSFVTEGGVWGLLGDKGAGKSSLLATLALERDAPVMADDILVIDDRQLAYAGPRCMDLRREAAEAWGVGAALGRIGARERWRVPLPPVPTEVPFRGWVHLVWGDRLETQPVPAVEAFERLGSSLALHLIPPDPASLLALAALPTVRLVRPRDLDGIATTADVLLQALDDVVRPR